MKKILFVFLSLVLGYHSYAQLLPDEFHNRNDKNWYNRKTGSSLWFSKITEGKPQEAVDFAKTQMPDMEAEFLLAIAYAHLEKTDSAVYFARQSLDHGIPLSRYLAGDMYAMQPLLKLNDFQNIIKIANPGIIHGPMIGDVSTNKAKVWVRTHLKKNVVLEVSKDESFFTIEISINATTDPSKENTAIFNLENLEGNTRYYYRAKTEKTSYKSGSFRTLGQDKFSIAFGACSAHIPWREYMWSTMYSHRPDAFFTLGDNVFIDYPKNGQVQQYCYHQRQSNAHWQKFVANTPVYAIWDDHDFGDNDDFGELKKYEPAWKYDNWKRFQNQWANASYGGGNEDPGVWFKKSMGDVDFFFLDARYYREPSFINEEKDHALTMLGPVQKQWLTDELLKSTAKFKVVISSVPWAFPAKEGLEGKIDTWLGYPEERDELFGFLTENEISGVFLLSGDRHRADLWKIERANDYPLYELEVGRLTNTHRHPAMPGVLFSYKKKDAFGKLNFDFTAEDPSVQYEIWSIDNELIFEHNINLSELNK
ncbi:MAG: alkaline phosphatase D family protein [Ekhidna sp.]|nr:alkaline phosphatase D family protein [Ekhidna sp.]